MSADEKENLAVPRPDGLELSLVIPVYNGEAGIEATLRQWGEVLSGLRREIIVLDDGSTDGTGEVLDRLAASGALPGLSVVHKPNSGHGPTIYRGYATARGDWVFQADSDNEVDPAYFPRLWGIRERADLVLGRRRSRQENWVRRAATGLIPFATWPWSRRLLRDINVPFRLYRRDKLVTGLKKVRPDAFAPNALLSIVFARGGERIVSVPVPHRHDGASGKSLAGARFFRALRRAWKDLRHTPAEG
ncbi:MAG TPA: glycosyltransferase family 2 protein [bacterium]|nr:glycosyltransferase family 2 protein [bacterium]HPJ71387.1 glycosyltransferase family 2 protein [bacterium]HPQ66306.1 glycosyltransferase family 2 protein [bacterium]